MCGSLQLTAKERMIVAAGQVIPGKFLNPIPRYTIALSSHRFIREEKELWWRERSPVHETLLQAVGFYERRAYFAVPLDYKIRCFIHHNIERGDIWVMSIVTTDTNTRTGDDVLEKLKVQVALVHHRMPALVKV